jgi:hypothetical protein
VCSQQRYLECDFLIYLTIKRQNRSPNHHLYHSRISVSTRRQEAVKQTFCLIYQGRHVSTDAVVIEKAFNATKSGDRYLEASQRLVLYMEGLSRSHLCPTDISAQHA